MVEKISLTVQTLYAQLLESAGRDIRLAGSLYEKTISKQKYLYCKSAIGGFRKDKYLGKVGDAATEELRQKILDSNQFIQQRRQLVRMLKAELPQHLPDLAQVMLVLQHFRIFDNPKTVLVGTNAYICYTALVGHRLDHAVMTTDDADIATLDLTIGAEFQDQSLLAMLQYADDSFAAVPELSKKALPSRFRARSGLRVDLITQQRNAKASGTVRLESLSAGAVPLQHVAWLVENPTRAVVLHDVGALVYVPQPARFAMHKLILAQKRLAVERLKRQKDLVQAKSLIAALLRSDPHSLRDCYESACAQGAKGWAVPLQKSLAEIDVRL